MIITPFLGTDTVKQDTRAQLLGIPFNDKQKWYDQISGPVGLISSLNERLFLIRRLKNSINSEGFTKISNSIFMSKIRYGIHMFGRVRLTEEEPKNSELMVIQKVHYKLIRLLNNVQIKDKITRKCFFKILECYK